MSRECEKRREAEEEETRGERRGGEKSEMGREREKRVTSPRGTRSYVFSLFQVAFSFFSLRTVPKLFVERFKRKRVVLLGSLVEWKHKRLLMLLPLLHLFLLLLRLMLVLLLLPPPPPLLLLLLILKKKMKIISSMS